MWSHIGSGSIPEKSPVQENPELKIPVRNGRSVTKLRSQFGFYLNLKKFVRNGHRCQGRFTERVPFLVELFDLAKLSFANPCKSFAWNVQHERKNAQVFCGSTQKTRTDHEKLKFAKSKGSSSPGTIPVNVHGHVCRHERRYVCWHVYWHVSGHVWGHVRWNVR